MGKSYSKSEEIIIAQNGANNANQSSVEQKLELYGAVVASVLVLLILFAMCFLCKKCKKGATNWAKKELITVMSTSQIDKIGQQQTPNVQYA